MRAVEAPFQLVVSVIAMALVMALAYLVLQNATQEDCNNKWDIELRKVASALSTVIQGSAPTKVFVKFDFRCGEAKKYVLRVRTEKSSHFCLRVCGQVSGEGCGIAELEVLGQKGGKEVTLGKAFACIEGMGGYVNWGSGCSQGKDVTGSLRKGLVLDPPFGAFMIRKRLGGEDVVVCRVR